MKYFKYGFYSIVKKPLFNILIMIEIAIILIAGNMTISVFNSRSSLYNPYADIFTKDGYCFYPLHSGYYDRNLEQKNFFDSLKGDLTIINSYSVELIKNNSLASPYQVVIIDDRIFSKLKLTLLDGRWASSQKNSDGEVEVVATQGDSCPEIGSVIDTDSGKLKVVGIIGKNSFAPTMIRYTKDRRDARMFYDLVGVNVSNRFFASSSAAKEFIDPHYISGATFIWYNSRPSEDIRKYNNELLIGQAMQLIELSELNANSQDYINEQYIKLMPILLCVFIIILAELICSVAMNTRSQMRNYGIYFLCGCRWKDCLKISSAYSLIILSVGTLLGAAGFILFQFTEYAKIFEQNMEINNLFVTLGIFVLMLIISLIIPFFQVYKTTPVETIKENR